MAEDKVTCGEVIAAADKALAAKDQEIKICRLGLSQTIDENAALNSEINSANSKLSSPFRNPFIMATVGVVLGIVVVGIVKK